MNGKTLCIVVGTQINGPDTDFEARVTETSLPGYQGLVHEVIGPKKLGGQLAILDELVKTCGVDEVQKFLTIIVEAASRVVHQRFPNGW